MPRYFIVTDTSIAECIGEFQILVEADNPEQFIENLEEITTENLEVAFFHDSPTLEIREVTDLLAGLEPKTFNQITW